jgi:hypothetical protein
MDVATGEVMNISPAMAFWRGRKRDFDVFSVRFDVGLANQHEGEFAGE